MTISRQLGGCDICAKASEQAIMEDVRNTPCGLGGGRSSLCGSEQFPGKKQKQVGEEAQTIVGRGERRVFTYK